MTYCFPPPQKIFLPEALQVYSTALQLALQRSNFDAEQDCSAQFLKVRHHVFDRLLETEHLFLFISWIALGAEGRLGEFLFEKVYIEMTEAICTCF